MQSHQNDPSSRGGFGPFVPGFEIVPYDDLAALVVAGRAGGADACTFMVEPIQGEAGVVIPSAGYMAE